MSLTDLRKELKKFDKTKLIDLISELYKKHKPVKEFFDFFVHPDENALFQKYKAQVLDAFYPKRGFHLKLRDARQAISEFKKFGPSNYLVADLMLFYVECGVQFTNDFGDINENFYLSMEKMFDQSLALMNKEDILHQFKDRAAKILKCTYGIGWFFHDTLLESYYTYYEEMNNDAEIKEEETKNVGKIIPFKKI